MLYTIQKAYISKTIKSPVWFGSSICIEQYFKAVTCTFNYAKRYAVVKQTYFPFLESKAQMHLAYHVQTRQEILLHILQVQGVAIISFNVNAVITIYWT